MSMKQFNLNEADFESPGYEYLRSYQNMSILLHKLVALNYQNEFCTLYKCPPIHRYYFSVPSKSSSEQLFVYTCLCAWLIKEKCHMNLELKPEEYEDPDVTISVIIEAITLLLYPDGDNRGASKVISWNRLHQGFGPEVIWTLNILADRAMELTLESKPEDSTIKIIHNNKAGPESNDQGPASYITIGQPFVGGGLTTRPLGSYQIDDKSLLFDDDDEDAEKEDICSDLGIINDLSTEEWLQRVDRFAETDWLKEPDRVEGLVNANESMPLIVESKNALETLIKQTRPQLVAMSARIGKQMQQIANKEKMIQTHLGVQNKRFLESNANYSRELARNEELSKQVEAKTDLFEELNQRLRQLDKQIEKRIRELNDVSVLQDLESKISNLKLDTIRMDTQIGLLLHLCGKLQSDQDDT